MPSFLQLQNIAYDLTQYLGLIGTHPSVQTKAISGESFATCVTSQNWKPFVVGILAPDNPINFVPVRRIMQEIKKAEMPQGQLPGQDRPTYAEVDKVAKSGKDAKGANAGNIVPMEHKNVPIDEVISSLSNAWAKRSGSPPSPELLALLVGNLLNECSGTKMKDGKTTLPSSISPPNYNAWGYHDVGTKPPTYMAQWNAETSMWEDGKGNTWFANGAQGQNDGTIGMLRGKPPKAQLWFAPQDGKSTLPRAGGSKPSKKGSSADSDAGNAQKFYAAIDRPGSRFLGTDTEGGVVYISSYRAFPTWQDAADEFIRYVYTSFPDVKDATTPEGYNDAIQNRQTKVGTGEVEAGSEEWGRLYNFHDTSDKVNADYVKGLRRAQEAFLNHQESQGLSGGSSGVGGADATDDPSQRIMAYGASFDPDNPLEPAFGRNIAVDEYRTLMLYSQMNGIKAQLEAMRNIPQLLLLVNPQEFRRSHENMVDFGTKTRVGNVVHTWLEQPIKISASGQTASQFAVYADMTGGLTNYNRVHSLSYRNLMSLMMLYKNNGMLYDFPSGTDSGTGGQFGSVAGDGSIILTGSVFIYYDDHVYIGSFDNFSITDDASKPHNLAYSFAFTVRYDIHIDIGVDAQLSSVFRG
jgi:hypothetical protein